MGTTTSLKWGSKTHGASLKQAICAGDKPERPPVQDLAESPLGLREMGRLDAQRRWPSVLTKPFPCDSPHGLAIGSSSAFTVWASHRPGNLTVPDEDAARMYARVSRVPEEGRNRAEARRGHCWLHSA